MLVAIVAQIQKGSITALYEERFYSLLKGTRVEYSPGRTLLSFFFLVLAIMLGGLRAVYVDNRGAHAQDPAITAGWGQMVQKGRTGNGRPWLPCIGQL